MSNIIIEPTAELYEAPINGQLIPCRIWKGRTAGGIACEVYVLSVTPDKEADMAAFAAEFAALRRSRDVYEIDRSGG